MLLLLLLFFYECIAKSMSVGEHVKDQQNPDFNKNNQKNEQHMNSKSEIADIAAPIV